MARSLHHIRRSAWEENAQSAEEVDMGQSVDSTPATQAPDSLTSLASGQGYGMEPTTTKRDQVRKLVRQRAWQRSLRRQRSASLAVARESEEAEASSSLSSSSEIELSAPTYQRRSPKATSHGRRVRVPAQWTILSFTQAYRVLESILAGFWSIITYLASWFIYLTPFFFIMTTLAVVLLAVGYLGYLVASFLQSVAASVCAVPYGHRVLRTVGHEYVCSSAWWGEDTGLHRTTPFEHLMKEEPWAFFDTAVDMTTLPKAIFSLRVDYLRPLESYVRVNAHELHHGQVLNERVRNAVVLAQRMQAPAVSFVNKQKTLIVATKYMLTSVASDLQKTVDSFESRWDVTKAAAYIIFDIFPTLDKFTPRHHILADLFTFVNITLPRLKELEGDAIDLMEDLDVLEKALRFVDEKTQESMTELERSCPLPQADTTPGAMARAWVLMAGSKGAPPCRREIERIRKLLASIRIHIAWTRQVVTPAYMYVQALCEQVQTTHDAIVDFDSGHTDSKPLPVTIATANIKTFIEQARSTARNLDEITTLVDTKREQFRKAAHGGL